MADNSHIEWTDASWTPIRAQFWQIQNDGSGKERIGWHCTHVSEGCRNCYAERINRRLGTGRDYAPDELYREEREGYYNGEVKVFLDEKMLSQPLRWAKPRKIFVCSMTDLFADFVPDEWIDRVFAVMALAPQHTFQVLTKRAERMRGYLASHDVGLRWHKAAGLLTASPTCPVSRQQFLDIAVETVIEWIRRGLPNVWLGVSLEDQARADERIPLLLDTPAAVRFISAEPLLGGINLSPWLSMMVDSPDVPGYPAWTRGLADPALDWVIAGGESGPNARPMHPSWARSLRDQCQAAGVSFFFKQWGEWLPVCEVPIAELAHDAVPGTIEPCNDHTAFAALARRRLSVLRRVGKKAADRHLDGREWSEFPT